MSTPPFLTLPPGVSPARLPTGQGDLAALVAGPAGPADPRPPVLLVPGFTGSKEDFIAILAPIAGAGHPVTAIDQRGQFESAGTGEASAYDVKALAEDVLAVARHLGAPVHLLGHSFGGLVARAAALADHTALRSLTLMSSGPAAIPHPAASNLELIARALPVMDLESIWAVKRQMEVPTETVPLDPETEEWLHRRFVANDPVALLRLAEQLLTETDRVDELARVALPVHVVYGDADDAWTPGDQAAMAARLGAAVTVLQGCAHSPAAELPEPTAAALLDFWAGH